MSLMTHYDFNTFFFGNIKLFKLMLAPYISHKHDICHHCSLIKIHISTLCFYFEKKNSD